MRATQVGEELRFTPSALRDLAVGGLLHDIGKLSLPRAILQKPGKLTDAEYLQIQRHPELGAQILTQLGGFSVGVATLVTDHHERLDGSGYPHRLAGDERSDAARILGVCDVYDALISTRVYRAAWSDSDAIRYLREDAAVQFDQRVVDALALVLERETISESLERLSPHRAEALLQRRTTRGARSPKTRFTR
jgi:HD-GYP domain-containing protein (c-di-GMP phosphodiesterase class II)